MAIEDLIKALRACVTQHPVLSTVVSGANTNRPQLARVANVNLREHIRTLDDTPKGEDEEVRMQDLLRQIHNQPWDHESEIPPWRLYALAAGPSSSDVLHGTHIAFASSHALLDGMSGYAFHTTLLRGLQYLGKHRTDDDPICNASCDVALPPALDRAATFPISWSFLLRPAMNEFLPRWLASACGVAKDVDDNTWCGVRTRPRKRTDEQLISTAVRVSTVPYATLQQVLATCRKYESRLTALLNHLISKALVTALHRRGHTHTNVVISTAIDLRKCIPAAEGTMANYASAVDQAVSIASYVDVEIQEHGLTSSGWAAIKLASQELQRRSSTLADQPVALLKYLTDLRAWTSKQAAKASDVAFGMSNLGVFSPTSHQSLNADAHWSIQTMLFSQSADGTGPPFNVNVASVSGGPLSLVITWWPGMLGSDDEETFVDELCEHVVGELEVIAHDT